jgi:hypothetical protein
LVMLLFHLFLALILVLLAALVAHCSLLFGCESSFRREWRRCLAGICFAYLHWH